ncbi:interleukin-31 receptor subunit alpha-like [Lampris incognitus]|uniref:interleukin-31 receptor subunit alpha-like n=1 Tax=Lampris incognitus TaxID=2546036 RepID=UPI0024B4CD76|nr:interleukin-31 receptor subunit alpha-like [Lampris incognitus]
MYSLTVLFVIFVIPAGYEECCIAMSNCLCHLTGQLGKTCSVFTKDQYVKFGSDVQITCQSSCIQGKSYWTMNNMPIDDSLSETINSSYTVLFLRNFTGQRKINPPKIQVSPLSSYLLHVLNKTMNPKDDRGSVIIKDVESCTDYTVSARCALEEAPWSEWSQKRTVLSEVDKGTVKLDLWRKIAEPGKSGFRKVHALWKGIPPSCRGEFSHTVKPTSYKKRALFSDEAYHSAVFCSPSYCNVEVDRNAHEVTLTVLHNGSFLQKESVYVPAIGESECLPEVSGIQTSISDGKILVSWKAPNRHVSGYMVDWTHDGVTYFWKESRYTNTTLDDVQDFKKYNIAVTPLFDDKTGLESKVLRVCSRKGGPETIVITDVLTKDRSALVSWNIESQSECRGQVVIYTIFYRTEDGPQLNVSVNGTKRETLLEDLKPNNKYSVNVMAIAENGSISSIVRYFETKRFDPSLILTLSICGGVLIFLVLSLGLCCAVQWKKFREKKVPDPGHSSLVSWFSQSHHKTAQSFSHPSESRTIYERVYPCELDSATYCLTQLTTDTDDYPEMKPASSQSVSLRSSFSGGSSSEGEDCGLAEEKSDTVLTPAKGPAPVPPKKKPAPHEGVSPPEEVTLPPASENVPFNPYRSQNSVNSPVLSKSEGRKATLAQRQQNKTAPLTVYVSVDMFEQGQSR